MSIGEHRAQCEGGEDKESESGSFFEHFVSSVEVLACRAAR